MNSLMPCEIQYYRIRTARTYKERLAHKFVFEIPLAKTISFPDGSIHGPRRTRMWELRSQKSRFIFHPLLAAIVRARRTCFCNCDAPDRPSAAPSATCTFCRRKIHASIFSHKPLSRKADTMCSRPDDQKTNRYRQQPCALDHCSSDISILAKSRGRRNSRNAARISSRIHQCPGHAPWAVNLRRD